MKGVGKSRKKKKVRISREIPEKKLRGEEVSGKRQPPSLKNDNLEGPCVETCVQPIAGVDRVGQSKGIVKKTPKSGEGGRETARKLKDDRFLTIGDANKACISHVLGRRPKNLRRKQRVVVRML